MQTRKFSFGRTVSDQWLITGIAIALTVIAWVVVWMVKDAAHANLTFIPMAIAGGLSCLGHFLDSTPPFTTCLSLYIGGLVVFTAYVCWGGIVLPYPY